MAVSFFSYQNGTSFLYRVGAGKKILSLFLFCLLVFIQSPWPYAQYGAAFFVCLILFFLSGRNLSSIKPLGYVLIFGAFAAFGGGLKFGAMWTLKFLLSAYFSQVVFMTTSSLQIKAALEKSPLGKTRLSLIIFLALGFIPQIFLTWERVKKAARSRGGSKRYFSQLEALFSCLLAQAETKRKALVNRGALPE